MNTGSVEINPMVEKDLPFVNETRNIESTRRWLENDSIISLEDTVKWFREKKPHWYIISSNFVNVGYLRTSDDTGKSICIGCDIHPDFRRRGYATKAYRLLIGALIEKGYVNIWLDVFKENTPALNLYKNLGFIPIGDRIVRSKVYTTMVYMRSTSSE